MDREAPVKKRKNTAVLCQSGFFIQGENEQGTTEDMEDVAEEEEEEESDDEKNIRWRKDGRGERLVPRPGSATYKQLHRKPGMMPLSATDCTTQSVYTRKKPRHRSSTTKHEPATAPRRTGCTTPSSTRPPPPLQPNVLSTPQGAPTEALQRPHCSARDEQVYAVTVQLRRRLG